MAAWTRISAVLVVTAYLGSAMALSLNEGLPLRWACYDVYLARAEAAVSSDPFADPVDIAAAAVIDNSQSTYTEQAVTVAAALSQIEGVQQVEGNAGGVVTFRMSAAQAQSADVRQACSYLVPILQRTAVATSPDDGEPPFNEGATRSNAAVDTAATVATEKGPLDTTQGSRSMKVDYVQRNYPYLTGKGVKIGIISDSYWNLAAPGVSPCRAVNNAEMLRDLNNMEKGADEGRGMAELICFVAPEASLYFHTAYSTEEEFAAGILDLKVAGCDIIVDDIGYFREAFFSTGIVAQAVNKVYKAGAAYFSAAGNDADAALQTVANWAAFPAGLPGINKTGENNYFNWGTPENPIQLLQINLTRTLANHLFFLQWDEPYARYTNNRASPSSDIDLIICSNSDASDCTTVLGQDDNIDKVRDAAEIVYISDGRVGDVLYMAIRLARSKRSPNNQLLSLYGTGGWSIAPGQNGYALANGSTIYGHPNTPGAMSVGASWYKRTPAINASFPAPVLESFSSWGTTPLLFDVSGTRLAAPVVLQKPDIVAPDGTDTSFFYADEDANGWPDFFGTSASAPHAAAVAALMLQQKPWLKPDGIYAAMRSTAQDMLEPGWDKKSGWGFIQANKLLAGLPNTCRGKPFGAKCELDGLPCTEDRCNRNATCQGSNPKTCTIEMGPCKLGVCNPATGRCELANQLARGTPCFDGKPCVTRKTCNGSGQCTGGTRLPFGTACDDGDKCTRKDTCNTLGVCKGTRISKCK